MASAAGRLTSTASPLLRRRGHSAFKKNLEENVSREVLSFYLGPQSFTSSSKTDDLSCWDVNWGFAFYQWNISLKDFVKSIFILKRFEIITFTMYCSIFRALRLLRDGHAFSSSSSISFFLALDFHPLSVVHHDSLRQCTFDESKLELILFMFFPRPSYILLSLLKEFFFLKFHFFVQFVSWWHFMLKILEEILHTDMTSALDTILY